MNMLLRFGGPKIDLIVGFICICAAIGALLSAEHFTLKLWLRVLLLAVVGIACLASGRNSIRRRCIRAGDGPRPCSEDTDQLRVHVACEGLRPRSGRSWNAIVVNRILRVQARVDAEPMSAVA
jgi:hypothetical protein